MQKYEKNPKEVKAIVHETILKRFSTEQDYLTDLALKEINDPTTPADVRAVLVEYVDDKQDNAVRSSDDSAWRQNVETLVKQLSSLKDRMRENEVKMRKIFDQSAPLECLIRILSPGFNLDYDSIPGKINLKVTRDNGLFGVWLYKSKRREFNTQLEAEEYAMLASKEINLALHLINLIFSKLQAEIQPNIFTLGNQKIRKYNELVQWIGMQINQITHRYSGQTNHQYFKKLFYITEKVLALSVLVEDDIRGSYSTIWSTRIGLQSFLGKVENGNYIN